MYKFVVVIVLIGILVAGLNARTGGQTFDALTGKSKFVSMRIGNKSYTLRFGQPQAPTAVAVGAPASQPEVAATPAPVESAVPIDTGVLGDPERVQWALDFLSAIGN